ncbi:hypothetical protein K505DRAFT_298737 [Melanomma pulvis-pyrius CBS 109.77]|uniref:Rhodopsin domain-containing protein n=1 Tax=Melanomma pulvis-pyrius CBS 109.77 TaxID=1314802 RepID=A0A6A6XLH9_9PLEO|nr:hypothetical protein K505DRAFT_298737 [Melanomma pulvis-pyrius CBS 109.77]
MSMCAAAAGLTAPPEGYIGNQFQNVAITFIVLGTLAVGLRFYARHKVLAPLGMDDIFVIIALVSNLALCAICLSMVHWAEIGHHTLWVCMMNPMALITYAKLQIPFTIMLSFAIAFAKLAILSLFLRIFVQKGYRWATYGIMGIQVLTLVVSTIITCTVCTPISYLWEPQLHPDGHCIDINAFWRWGSFPQIITDVLILILPLPILWKLHLSPKDKIGVILTFCTGSIGLVTSIVRFVIFWRIDGQTDSTWVASTLGCISIAECGVYLLAACLPIYRSLFLSVKSRTTTGYGSKASYGKGGSSNLELRSLTQSGKGFERLETNEVKDNAR